MFPFWDDVIAPLIEAVDARRVIEIGALRGETTVRMLARLGADCELHVIDPLPQFDPAEHEEAFPGQYIFHLGISHDVLPTLPAADVALVDGDHNWYTVYNELKMLAATAREADVPLPLLICHDVCWPYGRRDLYYEPSRIPKEFRLRHGRAGMLPGVSNLLIGGFRAIFEQPVFHFKDLPLLLSADDPLTFATTLADDYAYAWAGMILPGKITPTEATERLTEAARNSVRYAFAGPTLRGA